jgi:glycosyltransferase involved in cell wall biosynthesis
VTLFDALPWLQEEPGWPAGFYRDRLLPAAFRKCAAVVTSSQNSYRDVIRLWPELKDKTHVIPLGVGDHYLDAPDRPLSESFRSLGVRQPYLLYLGGDVPRKRLTWAIRVLDTLDETDVSLVACGIPADVQPGILASLPSRLRGRLCFAPFIDEAAMPNQYLNAAAVLYPTLYEGFGFPAVEAQAVGTPVLFSALGSLGELEGPASFVLPPDDLGAWVAACWSCLTKRGGKSKPDEAARRWARRFSWDVCAARHLEVYRTVANKLPEPAVRPAYSA